VRGGLTLLNAADRRGKLVDVVDRVELYRKSADEELSFLEARTPVIVLHCLGLIFDERREKFRREEEATAEDIVPVRNKC